MSKEKKIKCVVWDLDNTIWNGILLEDENISLREGITEIIRELDNRGILQSIASRNDHNKAMAKLENFGLDEYFLYPQISWNIKSSSVQKIANLININPDTIAFIDDQQFELDEVQDSMPEVFCLRDYDVGNLLEREEFNPAFLTEDSKKRRLLYKNDIVRNSIEESFKGTKEAFLASLDMKFTISKVNDGDLERAEELTVRTHQMNTTGYTYGYEELDFFRKSNQHKLYISDLTDKYGDYGKIGLTLIECTPNIWTIKLLLMSCRVMSRGVGSVMLNYIMAAAKKANVKLRAEFVQTDRNRPMYITYKFSGFKEIEHNDNSILFECDLSKIQDIPEYIDLVIKE